MGTGLITAILGRNYSTWDAALRQLSDSWCGLLGDLADLDEPALLLAGIAALGVAAVASDVSRTRRPQARFESILVGGEYGSAPLGIPEFVLSEVS